MLLYVFCSTICHYYSELGAVTTYLLVLAILLMTAAMNLGSIIDPSSIISSVML